MSLFVDNQPSSFGRLVRSPIELLNFPTDTHPFLLNSNIFYEFERLKDIIPEFAYVDDSQKAQFIELSDLYSATTNEYLFDVIPRSVHFNGWRQFFEDTYKTELTTDDFVDLNWNKGNGGAWWDE